MDATQLRTGNYLQSRNNEVFKVDAMQISWIEDEINEQLTHYWDYIPLTEDWLLKFGFEKAGENEKFIEYLCSDFFWIFYVKNKNKFQYYYSPDDFHIDYVHQLQNLFYSLAGKELQNTGLKINGLTIQAKLR